MNDTVLFQYKQGKVGPDGKELIPQESPKVNGYGFVTTPSPAPGKSFFFLIVVILFSSESTCVLQLHFV